MFGTRLLTALGRLVARLSGAKEVCYVNGADVLPPPLSPEELSEQVRANIRENYPPATYEDLMRLTKEWPQIVAETGQFARKYLMQARVNPAEAEGVLNLIFEDIPENKGAIDYFIGDGGLREQTGNRPGKFRSQDSEARGSGDLVQG